MRAQRRHASIDRRRPFIEARLNQWLSADARAVPFPSMGGGGGGEGEGAGPLSASGAANRSSPATRRWGAAGTTRGDRERRRATGAAAEIAAAAEVGADNRTAAGRKSAEASQSSPAVRGINVEPAVTRTNRKLAVQRRGSRTRSDSPRRDSVPRD